jgi:hypothetical protein
LRTLDVGEKSNIKTPNSHKLIHLNQTHSRESPNSIWFQILGSLAFFKLIFNNPLNNFIQIEGIWDKVFPQCCLCGNNIAWGCENKRIKLVEDDNDRCKLCKLNSSFQVAPNHLHFYLTLASIQLWHYESLPIVLKNDLEVNGVEITVKFDSNVQRRAVGTFLWLQTHISRDQCSRDFYYFYSLKGNFHLKIWKIDVLRQPEWWRE